jgi:hypothetical protein
MSVKTKQVQGRRKVRYESLGDFLSDAERLSTMEIHTIGNWSFGQILNHMAIALNSSIDGSTFMLPAPARLVMRLLMKRKFLTQSIPPGFKTAAQYVPKETSIADGLNALRSAIDRQNREAKRALHPGFGRLSSDEWNEFNLRHAEMHMSYVVLVNDMVGERDRPGG